MINRDMELELDVTKEVQVEKQLEEIQEKQLDLLNEKQYKFGNILRVYVDVKKNRKLIDNFAAYALGLISYSQACANEKGYYVITDAFIKYLEGSGYEIKYIFWKRKIEPETYYKEYDKTIDFNNNMQNEPINENSIEFIEKLNNLKTNVEKEYLNNIVGEGLNNADNLQNYPFKK